MVLTEFSSQGSKVTLLATEVRVGQPDRGRYFCHHSDINVPTH